MNLIKCIFLYLAVYLRVTISFADNTSANCTDYRNKFSNYTSHFTSCAIMNSRPITLCESCVDTYINVLESYTNMSKFSDEDGPCITNYINLDRLQILETMYRSSYDLWNRAKCYECFKIVDGSLTHNRSEETIKFNQLLNNTLQCVHATNNSSIICNNCLEKYLKLNDFYYNMINENDRIAGCMDIVDLMNGTRTLWSKTCCMYRQKPEYIFIGSTIAMFFVTALFYILAKYCTDIRTPLIFQQSRFAESLHNSG